MLQRMGVVARPACWGVLLSARPRPWDCADAMLRILAMPHIGREGPIMWKDVEVVAGARHIVEAAESRLQCYHAADSFL